MLVGRNKNQVPINGYLGKYAYRDKIYAYDVGLDRVDNTNDLEKPISNAVQAAIDSLTSTHNTDVTNLQNSINTTNSNLAIVSTDLSTAQNDIVNLQTNMSTAQTDIVDIQNILPNKIDVGTPLGMPDMDIFYYASM